MRRYIAGVRYEMQIKDFSYQNKYVLAKGISEDTVLKLIAHMKEESHQVITLYYGEDVKEEDAGNLCAKIAELYPDCDVDYHSGGQPVYYYVLSFE